MGRTHKDSRFNKERHEVRKQKRFKKERNEHYINKTPNRFIQTVLDEEIEVKKFVDMVSAAEEANGN